MSHETATGNYLDIAELSVRTGLSLATLHRLKRAGKIPYFQPGGKGGRILFPLDAIERADGLAAETSPKVQPTADSPQRLSGPVPGWMQH